MNEITVIRPVSDEDTMSFVSAEALADLAELITSMPIRHDSHLTRRRRRTSVPGARSRPTRLRWPQGLALAAAAAAAVVGVMTLGRAGSRVGPIDLGPADAQALAFTTEGRYIVVIVRNLYADPARYRAEFAAHHLNIKLQIVPASPSETGSLVGVGSTNLGGLKPITAKGKCNTTAGAVCPVGVKVPVNFTGSADLVFGRPARPGEEYDSAGSVTALGEAMHGLNYRDKTVNAVLRMLRAGHVTAPQYRWNEPKRNYTKALRPNQVPGDWIVMSAIPFAPNQVLLFVKPNP
jgi:hypothetical protein